MQSYKVVVVEDEWLNAQYLVQILKSLNQIVVAVNSCADEVFETLAEVDVDLIFMDIDIDGGLNGIECAKRVSAQIPIVYTTGNLDSSIMAKASETNMYGYLIKQFTQKDVEAILHMVSAKFKKEISKDVENLEEKSRIKFNSKTKELLVEDMRINLTKREVKLFELLYNNKGNVVTSEQVATDIWETLEVNSSTIRDLIMRLRKKLKGVEIKNLSGVGYILTNQAKESRDLD